MSALMELKSMPPETAAEVLQFVADHEDFRAVAEAVGEDLAVEEVRQLLKELAVELRRQAAAAPRTAYNVGSCQYLTRHAKQIISCLSPMEEKSLLGAFGVIEHTGPRAVVTGLRAERKS